MSKKKETDEVTKHRIKIAIRQFDRLVKEALDQSRPEKYSIDDERNFIDDVAEAHAHLLPPEHAASLAARQRAARIESGIVRQTPDLLRDLFQNGQMPMEWYEQILYKRPVMVSRSERMRFDAMTPEDLQAAEVYMRRVDAERMVRGTERAEQLRRASELLIEAELSSCGSLHIVVGVESNSDGEGSGD